MVEENSKSQRKEDDSNNDKKNELSDTSKTSEFDKLMKGSSKPNNRNKLVNQNEISDDEFESNTETGEYSDEILDRISKVKGYNYKSPIELICLTFITCGFYSYYLTYRQTEAIRKIDKNNGLIEPILVILAIFFTCGLAGIYIHYKIPERAAYISRKSGGKNNPLRAKINPPIKELPMISLIGNIFFIIFIFILSVASGGILFFLFYPAYIAFWIWLTYSIQRSVEYMLCIEKPLEG